MEQTTRYSVIAPKQPGCVVVFEYTFEGKLLSITFNPDATEHFITKVGSLLPMNPQDLVNGKVWSGCQITNESIVDLAFERFWNLYNYKVGSKMRVAKKWLSLPDPDRMLAIGFIRRYKNWCDKKKIEYCYPETYLNQRRWENHIE